ncbi:MAG: hypothetical protein ACKOE6_04105 [Flammeovirgaceae bacterium]
MGVGAKKITAYKTFGGVVYELNDSVSISPKQVSMLLQNNPDAYNEFKLARSKNSIAAGLGFASGVLIAIPLVTAVAGGEPEWWYAGVGGGLAALSMPFLWSYRSHANGALEKYNGAKLTGSARIQPSIFFDGRQAGLLIRF